MKSSVDVIKSSVDVIKSNKSSPRLQGDVAKRRRALVSQERLAAKAQEKATKAEEKAPRIAPELETQDVANPETSDPEQAIVDNTVVQLDRPVPPSPAHTWVNGGTNRWGGYWRAPKRTKLAI